MSQATLQRGDLRVKSDLTNGVLNERWQLRRGNNWDTILQYSGPRIQVTPAAPAIQWQTLERQGAQIVARGKAGGIEFHRVIQLTFLRGLVTHVVIGPGAMQLVNYEDIYTFFTNQPDAVWAHSLKKLDTDFIPHWQFKCPAVIYQEGSRSAAIVPDIASLDGALLQRQPTYMDLHNDGVAPTTFSYGISPNILTSHAIYGRNPAAPIAWDGAPLMINHELWFGMDLAPNEAYRRIVKELWTQQGGPYLRAHPEAQQNMFFAQYNTLRSWREYIWRDFAQTYYRQYNDPGAPIATFVIERNVWANHEGTNNDGWFNAWFQQLRTALGLWVYGNRVGDNRSKEQATLVLNLALSAPRNNGCFPTIYWRGDDGTNNWFRSDGWAGFRDTYHLFDMTWTAYWLLRWREAAAPGEARILPFCRALADFLISRFRPNGCVPSWFEANFAERPELRDNNAETGSAALLFAELFHATGNNQYLQAAQRAVVYLRDSVFPAQRWYDFEAFLSCSPKPFDFTDPRTRQIPHNSLCTIVTAMAVLRLYEVGGDAAMLDFARRIGDYLGITQIVFPHPLLTPDLIAGYTSQNTDAEWSDARQAYACDFLFNLYEHTGDIEYLERGVGALRASSPIAPFENYAHEGSADIPGTFTGLHWGTGSMMASSEFLYARYREGYIHIPRRHGVGIDGCTISDLVVLPFVVRFRLTSPFAWPTPPVVVIDAAPTPMMVFANGQSLGFFSPAQLKAGIPVPLTSSTMPTHMLRSGPRVMGVVRPVRPERPEG